MQVGESSGSVIFKNGWTTVLSERAVRYQVGDRINYLGRKVSLSDRGDVRIPNKDFYLHVSMDDGKVASIEEKPLYSTEFGTCIAVLGRVFKKDEEAVSYTCLHHVFLNPQKLNKTLKELSDKAGKVARIQFFISGGQKQSEEVLVEVQEIIEQHRLKNPDIEFNLEKENITFGIADLGEIYLTDHMTTHNGGAFINAGFDSSGNPFQIIDVSFSSYNGDGSDIERIMWRN